MSKFFDNFPEAFEQYNPEFDFTDTPDSETRDENGEYHSYEDKPSLIFSESRGSGVKNLYWHSHGRVSRKGNKFSHLSVSEGIYYSTYDSNDNIHSFNNQPGEVFYDSTRQRFSITFYQENELHRENGEPAQYTFDENGTFVSEEYYEDGLSHRGKGLPSSLKNYEEAITRRWMVKGFAHNENGPFYSFRSNHDNQNSCEWALYNVSLKEFRFNTIKSIQEEIDAPLWLAFLRGFELVSEAQVNFVLDNNFHNELPLDWNLKTLGITNEFFDSKMCKLQKEPEAYIKTAPLKALLDITKFNNQC
jgi:hypothetical protein